MPPEVKLAGSRGVRHVGGMLSALGASVRRHDPDRFLATLFAPPATRETLFALYAFNHELARAREAASEPTLALIRLQWWREVVEGATKRHEVATPLAAEIAAGRLDRAALLGLVDGREAEAGPIATRAAWHDYLRMTAGGLMAEAGRVLGAPAAMHGRLATIGTAYGAAGVLRSVVAVAAQGRCVLPEEVLATHGLTQEAVIADPLAPPVQETCRALALECLPLLRQAGGLAVPPAARAAALPAVLARRDLARLARGRPALRDRGLGDRLAVLRAGMAGMRLG